MTHPLLPLAKRLRHTSTDAEACLWHHLRAGRLHGIKFKRQKPIGAYIVDFICIDRNLVIEVDGGQHLEQAERDTVRTRWLEAQGFTVLRFWNDDVLRDTDAVLQEILRVMGLVGN